MKRFNLSKAAILLHFRPGAVRAIWARPYLVLGAIGLLGLVLRLSLIAANRFYGDEALYSHWGLLIATGQDVLLKSEIVDKPPLFFYTLALFFKLFGASETAARLPNIIASMSGIVIVYELARALFDRRVATLAALFLALSPFDILFAPTAFTDAMMVALALGAGLAALKGRYVAAGLLLGLAALTKPTAVFFVPLILFFGAVALRRTGLDAGAFVVTENVGADTCQVFEDLTGVCPHRAKPAMLRLGSGLVAVTAVGALWDYVMRAGCPSVLVAGSVHYGGMKLVPLAGLLPHLGEWLGVMRWLTASPPLDMFLVAGVAVLVGLALARRERRPGWAYDLALAGFVVVFVGAHTVLSFAAWDRYLLGLAPILAILSARVVLLPFDLGLERALAGWRKAIYAALLVAFLGAAMLPPLRAALAGDLPVGSDHGQFEGIDQVAAYFKGNVAPGAAVFHHDEGWHYSYYMFDYPYSFYYYPAAPYVLDLVRRLPPDQGKYVALPVWADSGQLQATLKAGGWAMRDVYRTYRRDGALSFTVYRIEQTQ